jgi:sulfur relay (sulfurtransferase) DsrC/TusE family protein
MQEYKDRHELGAIYEKAKKRIKEQIELKGISCKGSAKGQALNDIISIMDNELGIGITEELYTATMLIREYYKKYNEVASLDRKIHERKQELEDQNKVTDLLAHLTDETLKNAVIAYNSLNDNRGRYGNKEDARAIAIAYINSKGREELKDVLEVAK